MRILISSTLICSVALADLNEVQDQLGLRLARGSRDRNEGENGHEGRLGISHGHGLR